GAVNQERPRFQIRSSREVTFRLVVAVSTSVRYGKCRAEKQRASWPGAPRTRRRGFFFVSSTTYAVPALSLAYRIITDESDSSTTLSIHDTIGIHFLAFRVPGRPRLATRLPCRSKNKSSPSCSVAIEPDGTVGISSIMVHSKPQASVGRRHL